MTTKYWEKFWVEYGRSAPSDDPQIQVLRTLNKKPIDGDVWLKTVNLILKYLDLKPTDHVVDLCCGNGLISREMSPKCHTLIAADISSDLLGQIDTEKYKNIQKINDNILNLELPTAEYDKVLLYAGLQYFDKKEVIELFHKVFTWLKPGGIFFIGDIPDQKKIWKFFNNQERESAYFNAIRYDKPIVGNWFDQEFLEKLSKHTGFRDSEHIKQNQDMIYSFFRFDMRFVR